MSEYVITYAACEIILGEFLLTAAIVWLLITQAEQGKQLQRIERMLTKLSAEDKPCDSN